MESVLKKSPDTDEAMHFRPSKENLHEETVSVPENKVKDAESTASFSDPNPIVSAEGLTKDPEIMPEEDSTVTATTEHLQAENENQEDDNDDRLIIADGGEDDAGEASKEASVDLVVADSLPEDQGLAGIIVSDVQSLGNEQIQENTEIPPDPLGFDSPLELGPAKTQNPKPVEGHAKEQNQTGDFQCAFCLKRLVSIESLKFHAINCDRIKTLEPLRKCRLCNAKMAESRSLMHEVTCSNSAGERPLNFTNMPMNCPKCNIEVANFNKLRYHLAMDCLKTLILLTKKSLELSSNSGQIEQIQKSFAKTESSSKKRPLPPPAPSTLLKPSKKIKTEPETDHEVETPVTENDSGSKKKVVKVTPTTQMRCIFCSQQMMWPNMKLHPLTCPAIRRLEPLRSCSSCPKIGPESFIYKHEITSHSKGSISCMNCNKTFPNMDELTGHFVSCLLVPKKALKKILAHHFKSSENKENDGKDNKNKPVKISLTKEEPPETRTRSRSRSQSRSSSVVGNGNAHASPGNTIYCLYCRSRLGKKSLADHAICCPEIGRLEPLRSCLYCHQSFPESKALVHEATTCPRKPAKLKTLIKCNYCATIVKDVRNLKSHLTKCLPTLTRLTKATLDNHKKTVDKTTTPDKTKKVHKAVHDDIVDVETVEADPVAASPPLDQDLKMVIGKPFSLAAEENKKKNSVKCPFCLKGFADKKSLMSHPVRCLNIKIYEPKHVCRHCSTSLPVSLCGLHEIVCEANPNGIPLTANNVLNTDIRCPSANCKHIATMTMMPAHMAYCLNVLQSILNNAIENDSLSWNEPISTNFIDKAGLTTWLKP